MSIDHGDASRRGPALRVQTEREDYAVDGEPTLMRRALEHFLGESTGEWPPRSQAGLTIGLRHDERRRRRMAATAALRGRPLSLEGRPAAFQLAETESCWSAVRRRDDLVLTVCARDIPVAALRLHRRP